MIAKIPHEDGDQLPVSVVVEQHDLTSARLAHEEDFMPAGAADNHPELVSIGQGFSFQEARWLILPPDPF
eukprot:847074-Prorocentrum_lima.AAC.1